MVITDELLQTINQLSDEQQQYLLTIARTLANTQRIRGESGESIVTAVGFFDEQALDEIESAINESDGMN